MNRKEIVEKYTIFETVVGSQLYGTSTPESDTDTKGIAIPPMEYYIGLKTFEQYEDPESDRVVYEIKKAISLMASANPNMLDMLFAPEEFWIKSSNAWAILHGNRHLFISKRIKNAFCGYATAQLKRMKNHKKWLVEPPKKPTREEFDVVNPPVNRELIKAVLSLPKRVLADDIQDAVRREEAYQRAKNEYKAFNEHMKNRNPARLKLENEIGYDSKHGMHLVRLLMECRDTFIHGEPTVCQSGKHLEFLMNIRNCKVQYDDVLDKVAGLEYEINELSKKSDLPDSPDMERIGDLCQVIIEVGI